LGWGCRLAERSFVFTRPGLNVLALNHGNLNHGTFARNEASARLGRGEHSPTQRKPIESRLRLRIVQKRKPESAGEGRKANGFKQTTFGNASGFFYKVLQSFGCPVRIPAVCIAREVPDGVSQGKLPPAQVPDNARHYRLAKGPSLLSPQQGEYKCLKREFLQSASPNLEGRSVRTSGSVLLEEMNDRRYGSWREVASLLVCCLFEHFPYRQMTMIWRLRGIWEYLRDD
jgi:hypothetical protein